MLTPEQINEIRQKAGIKTTTTSTNIKSQQGNYAGRFDYLLEKPKEKSTGRKVFDFFTSSSQKFGNTLGTAASVIDPQTNKNRDEALSSTQKQVDNYIRIAKLEPNKERATKFLEAAKDLADTSKIDIFNNPEYQKTAKQVIGEGLGTAIETLSLGSYGSASKIPTVLKPILSPAKKVLGGAVEGAKIGSAFGGAFGVAGALQENKSITDILKEGATGAITGGVGGAVLGGGISAIGIGGSAALNRGKEFTQFAKNKLGGVVEHKLEQTSRDLVKMSPTATKLEARWGKNTPQFIINEGILPLIDSDGKKLVTKEAVDALKEKYSAEATLFNKVLADSGEYISLESYRNQLLNEVTTKYKNKGSDVDSAINYINREIDSLKKNYRGDGFAQGDDLLVRVDTFNEIKSGSWSKTSSFNATQADKLQSDVNYQMGHVARDIIEETVTDAGTKQMSQRLGDFISAIRVLENAEGKTVPGGFFGRQFARIAGTIAGSGGGLPGSIIGNLTGGALADIANNPKTKTSILYKLHNSLNKTPEGRSIIDEATAILKQRGEERAARKLLEAPKFIPMGVKSDTSRLLTQQEAKELLESFKTKSPDLKKTNARAAVVPKEDPLIQEAKKYKSAEEFVKAQGAPVYHGTNREFRSFEKASPIEGHGTSGAFGNGFYFTDKSDYAKKYADYSVKKSGGQGRVEEAIVNLKKPFIIDKNTSINEIKRLAETKSDYSSLHNHKSPGDTALNYIIDNSQKFTDNLKKEGYDGVIATLNHGKGDFKEINVFDPSQIKTKSQLTDIWNKANKPKTLLKKLKDDNRGFIQAYRETGNLTTKILKDLEGKTTVSKQYILDATNRPELKQVERDLIRDILSREGNIVDVPKFAQKVKAELLPLKRTTVDARYENITLPPNERGQIGGYSEHIYNSPIETSAGDIHFGTSQYQERQDASGYFGHTRTEDLPSKKWLDTPNKSNLSFKDLYGGDTRRVIEVQSDLYQKSGLDKYKPIEVTSVDLSKKSRPTTNKIMYQEYAGGPVVSKEEISKLQQYNDPTAHFRIVREEVKKAAQDGKTKLQFPTGETAMKIEGLGTHTRFAVPDESGVGSRLATPIDVSVGKEVRTGGNAWIITDVLGDGKFKAVEKISVFKRDVPDQNLIEIKGVGYFKPSMAETFDISGKVDTNNPIYRFYEKDLGRYLKSKYNAQLVTDKQGVSWWEVLIKKEYGNKPVEAFGKAMLSPLTVGAGLLTAAASAPVVYNKLKSKYKK